MKRIKSACLIQTIGFYPKDEYPSEVSKSLVQKEYAAYKELMERRGTRYKILHEEVQSNGAILVELKKQYNQQPVGGYLD